MKTTVRYWTTLLPVSVRPDFHVHLLNGNNFISVLVDFNLPKKYSHWLL